VPSTRGTRRIGLAVVAVGLALAVGTQWWQARDATATTVNTAATPVLADFSLTTLDGQVLDAPSLKDKVLVVNFWATWCAPCREEFPSLVALQAQHPDDVQVIGLAFDDAPAEAVAAFAREFHVNFPIAIAGAPEAELFGGIIGFPTTFFVDRERHIVKTHVGYASAAMFGEAVNDMLRPRVK
jgi:thiol-disulfide isomerase/thioredoxin